MKYQNIHQLVTAETENFKLPISITENYDWGMYDHINTTVLYKNSAYKTGREDDKPFKNIIRPILNLQYRAEGFDVKDIILFINDKYKYFKSFLVKKFHEKWARENGIDTVIDESVESYVDFGGIILKNINQKKPEVVPMQRLAFCDQTDILSGPICERHSYSPDQLKEMEKKGWKNVEEVITLADTSRTTDTSTGQKAETPGKYIEVYEVHGVFPAFWLGDAEHGDSDDLVRQVHITTFYKDKEGHKQGITLFSGKERELPYKVLLRDKIYGRALGLGGAEELFEPQVWVNYDEIQKKNMLDAASKVVLQTTDPAFANRNKIQDMENLEITVTAKDTKIDQIPTTPVNLQLFENSTDRWEQHARQMGGATESIMGESPSAGTPFKLQELITAEAHSLHEYRKGKIAVFWDEVYRDWIIPYISREITNGQEFLAELDLTELQEIADQLVRRETNEMVKDMILNGEEVYPEDIERHKQMVREEFMRGGNKRFIEILEDEMRGLPMDIAISIKGKQKDLAARTDKLVNVFRSIVSNPNILQNPPMAKLFNEILESSDLSPIDFSGFTLPQPNQPVVAGTTEPLKELATTNDNRRY